MTLNPIRLAFLAMVALLAACDPADLADKAARKAADSVVFPVVNRSMPAGPAQAATDCILQNASADEIQGLARDVGVEAGSLTKDNIRAIALRPATQACFAAAGVPPVQ